MTMCNLFPIIQLKIGVNQMKVGEIIAMLRKELGYSRTEFANKIGIPHTTLRNYELGVREPGHSFIIQMANEFGVTTDFLLGLTQSRKNPSIEAEASTEENYSNQALKVAEAFDCADESTQKAVCKLLDIEFKAWPTVRIAARGGGVMDIPQNPSPAAVKAREKAAKELFENDEHYDL